MENKDQDETLAIAIALWRIQGERVARARAAVIKMERKVAQLQREDAEVG